MELNIFLSVILFLGSFVGVFNPADKLIVMKLIDGWCAHYRQWPGAMDTYDRYLRGEMLFQKRAAASGWRLPSEVAPP